MKGVTDSMTDFEKAIVILGQHGDSFMWPDGSIIPSHEMHAAFETALNVLKQNAPVPPETGASVDFGDMLTRWYLCGKCHEPIDRGDRFCRHCGRMVGWHDC